MINLEWRENQAFGAAANHASGGQIKHAGRHCVNVGDPISQIKHNHAFAQVVENNVPVYRQNIKQLKAHHAQAKRNRTQHKSKRAKIKVRERAKTTEIQDIGTPGGKRPNQDQRDLAAIQRR